MTHNERVTSFLASKGLTMDQAVQLPIEERKALDSEFRASRKAEYAQYFNDANAIKISRAAFRRLLPIGTQVSLVFAMGEIIDKPRTVAKHESRSILMSVPGKDRPSYLSFESGETYTKSNDILTINDSNGEPICRYRIFPAVL